MQLSSPASCDSWADDNSLASTTLLALCRMLVMAAVFGFALMALAWWLWNMRASDGLFRTCLSGGKLFPHVLQVDFHKFRIFLTF